MTRGMIASLAFAGLAAAIVLAPAPAALAQADTTDCDAVHARLQQRLASKIQKSFVKQQYASQLAGAYQRCLEGDPRAWDRIARTLG